MKEYKYCENCYTKNITANQECSVCGWKLNEKIYKKNTLLTIIFSVVIFIVLFLIFKFGFKSYGNDMKMFEMIYLCFSYIIIYALSNNFFNKPTNPITEILFVLPGIFMFVKPPEIPGVTNHEYRKHLLHTSHKRNNKISDLSDSKSYISIMINLGIIVLLIFIYSFIAIPMGNIQIISLILVVLLLCLMPLLGFLLNI